SLVLVEHYANRRPPKVLLLPSPVGDSVEKWLKFRRGGSLISRVPKRGDFFRLRKMADQNAEILVSRSHRSSSGSLEQRAANEGAALLGMASLD
ncbi:MAG TPA: hypothetical protein D7H72_03395, partial [Candidatus Poseidoniales archaeon]